MRRQPGLWDRVVYRLAVSGNLAVCKEGITGDDGGKLKPILFGPFVVLLEQLPFFRFS